MTDTAKIINELLPEMTKTECKIAGLFLNDPESFALDTLDALASVAKTSTTSIIRFCRRVGFDGFKSFQDSVRSDLKYRQSLPDKFLNTVLSNNDSLFVKALEKTTDCIKESFSGMSNDVLTAATDIISTANSVYTFGMRESFALSHYAYTRFLSVRQNVKILKTEGDGLAEMLLGIKKGDVCVAFLFHRYTKNALGILKFLKEKGVDVILVTAPPFDKISDKASLIIPCYTEIGGIKNSFAAPVCICDYLCSSVAAKMADKALDYMKDAEKLFCELDILAD